MPDKMVIDKVKKLELKKKDIIIMQGKVSYNQLVSLCSLMKKYNIPNPIIFITDKTTTIKTMEVKQLIHEIGQDKILNYIGPDYSKEYFKAGTKK